MALEKSRPSDSNVLNLDEARRKREKDSVPDEAFNATSDDMICATIDSAHDDVTMTPTNRHLVQGDNEDKTVRSGPGNRRFDKEKVDAIKAAMAKGEYQIDYMRVADKFIEHERYS